MGEPDLGFDPRTPGSQPEPKADRQLLSHPGVLGFILLTVVFIRNVLQIRTFSFWTMRRIQPKKIKMKNRVECDA